MTSSTLKRWTTAIALATAAAAVANAAPAGAPRAAPSASLQTADGTALRPLRTVSVETPRAARRAWATFLAHAGNGAWMATWDDATGVPSQIWGGYIDAPGTVASADAAERLARAVLAANLDLLAPGASAADFVLAANDLDHGMRSVAFFQYHAGMRVLHGQVSFRFKNDRLFVIGSEALPAVAASRPQASIAAAVARANALAWVAVSAGESRVDDTVAGPFVLPLVAATGVSAYRTVLRATVDTRKPMGRWAVYIDASTGAPVAREQMLRFGEGELLFNAPKRYPGAERLGQPARLADVQVNGAAGATDDAGLLTWAAQGAASITVRARGTLVSVFNDAGAEITADLTLPDGGSVTWDESGDEQADAQVDSFIHARLAKAYAEGIAPDMAWLDGQIAVTVNINDVCNAFSDGDSINFFLSGSGCENSGRIADVVYHEFGHSFHAHAYYLGPDAWSVDVDGGFGEGQADYMAVTITGDHGMGRGFFYDDTPMRDAEDLRVWPDDVGEIHDTGIIFSGAMWDVRKALVEEYGEQEGVHLADQLYYQTIRRAIDIPSTYVEILAADDDDGDLGNGTPHVCLLNQAFARHGLRAISAQIDPLAAELPRPDGFHVSVQVQGLYAQCPGDSLDGLNLHWEVRDDATTAGDIPMTLDGSAYQASIPVQPDGTVVKYRVDLAFASGTTTTFPENVADPMYEFFVGDVVPLYCTDFESDPAADGWTHGLTSGDASSPGADDWQWGEPAGVAGSGDPSKAFSGTHVFGNDLGLTIGEDQYNGMYQSDKINYSQSPVVPVGNYTSVRIQYWRWLNVEDAFFDKATIYVNGHQAWQNYNSDRGDFSSTQHQDREWRFHDIDASQLVQDGNVQVKFELSSDGGLEFGGWTLDDFCVVGYAASTCGDGEVTGSETCDEGDANNDTEADACRSNCRLAACGDGVVDSGEECDDSGATAECTSTCTRPPGVDTGDDDSGGGTGCGCRLGGNGADGGHGGAGLLVVIGVTLGFGVRRRRRGRSLICR